jgi:hypothetical protein
MIWKTTLAILVTFLSVGSSFAQFTTQQPDLRDCSGWNCPSNNFTLDDVYLTLVDLNNNPINVTTCTSGQEITAKVMLNYTSNANSTINSTRVFADLVIDGVTIDINVFLGDVPPSGSGQTREIYGPFTWTCGDELRLENILIVWRTGGNKDISQNYDCSDYNKAQCEFGTDTFVAAPLAVQFDYSICRSEGTTTVNYNSTTNGGKAPFTYKWDFTSDGIVDSNAENPSYTTTSTANFTTTLEVVDYLGTTNTYSVNIINPAEIELSVVKTDVGCEEQNSGSIDLSIAGGTAGYNILWSGPDNFSSTQEDISNLSAGIYNVTVTDIFGCEETLAVQIVELETPAAL